ncbi:hypothetical protein L596_006447 [Steinernema carpocapsae]|uniref:Uncharacterized protein n=1 Tax=Steinernema carpocapsae TaxID=34508 RepID=A0A4U8V434_STECR|nr:hypothetical protein L596_006447 [Steinernema carpocapsae]
MDPPHRSFSSLFRIAFFRINVPFRVRSCGARFVWRQKWQNLTASCLLECQSLTATKHQRHCLAARNQPLRKERSFLHDSGSNGLSRSFHKNMLYGCKRAAMKCGTSEEVTPPC